MKSASFSRLARAGLAGLCLILLSLGSHAEDLLFNCGAAADGSLDCNVVNAPNAVVPNAIKGLVYSVVDAMDGQITETVNTCDSPIASISTCSLNPEPFNPENPDKLDLICSPDPMDSTAVNCKLDAGMQTDVLRLDCFQLSDGTGTRCAFKSDQDKMTTQMTSDESFNSNEVKMMNSMMACMGNSNQEALCMTMMRIMMQGSSGEKEQMARFMRKLTPRKADAMMDVSSQNLRSATQVIKQRMGKLRSGQIAGTVNTQFFDGSQWHTSGTRLAQTVNSQSDVSPQPTLNIRNQTPWGVYINGSVIRSEQSSSELESSHEGDTQIITFGTDYRFNQHWYAGIAYNLADSTMDYSDNSGELDTASHALLLYSSYARGNWYLDMSLNYSRDSYEQARNASCSMADCGILAFDQTFSADFDGQQTALNLGTGYNWQLQQWTITPSIQLSQASIETDAYQEKASSTGAGSGYALDMDKAERDLTTFSIGAGIQYAISTDRGVWLPSFSLKAVKEFDDDVQVISGRFIGNIATDDSFNLIANEVDTTYLIVAAGFNVQLKNGNAAFVNLQSIENFDYLNQLQLTAGWRWEF